MPRLISPEDPTEVVDVPDDMAEHYLKLGARYAPPEEPGLEEPLVSPLDLIPFGGTVRPGINLARQAGPAALKGIGNIAGNLAEFASQRMVPRPLRLFGQILEGAAQRGGSGALTAEQRIAERAAMRAERAAERAVIRQERAAERAAIKAEKSAEVGSAASRVSARATPKAEPATKPARPASNAKSPKSGTKAPEKGTTASRKPRKSQAMRGASHPELVRREAARTKAIGRPANMGGGDLEAQMAQSLRVEEVMAQAGANPQQMSLARQALARGANPDELIQLFLGGAR